VVAQSACAAPTGPAVPPAVTGGDAALSSEQPGPAPGSAPTICWIGTSGNAALGARVIALDELVITFSDQNEVVAFPSDGAEVWRIPLGQPGQGLPGGLATDGHLVFAAAPVGLVALDPSDGSEAWEIAVQQRAVTGATGARDPAWADGRVFVVLDSALEGRALDRSLMAVDAEGGAELWRVTLDPTLPAGPVSADADTVVVWDGYGTLYAFEPEDGSQRWQLTVEQLGSPPEAQVSLGDDTLVTSLVGSGVIALSIADGALRWTFDPASGVTAAVTLQDERVYVNGVTELYALDAGDGSLLWSAPIQPVPPPFAYRPVPAVADDLVILGTTDVDTAAELIAFDTSDGSERWRTEVEIFGALLSPIVTGGRVYAPAFDVNGEGGLYAFGLAE
jgi:outer membrane protein assembly factor BamB